jgi:RNA polymerase sigma-70 factor, ECF subfamily
VNYSDLSPPDLVWFCAKDSDADFWKEFIRRFHPVIARSVIRVAAQYGTFDNSLIDDLLQETYLKICAEQCKLLRTFTPQGPESAFAFLKVVATNVAQDFFKGRLAQKRAPELTAETVEPATASPNAKFSDYRLTDAERAVLMDQIDRRLRCTLPPDELQRSRTVFWLYYRSGMTASAIASLPTIGLTTKGVESLLFRLTRLVREGISGAASADKKKPKGLQQAESF